MTPSYPGDLRDNLATFAVPDGLLAAVGAAMVQALPVEAYDGDFVGQQMITTYFDTRNFRLRRQRKKKDDYLTVRVRCYTSPYGDEFYSLSAKTESSKWREQLSEAQAAELLAGDADVAEALPRELQERLGDITDGDLVPVVAITCRRFDVEDDTDRFTLDCGVRTDRGKEMGTNILEYKSTNKKDPPGRILELGLRAVKLSKFLWATEF